MGSINRDMNKTTIKNKKFWLKSDSPNKEKFCLIECFGDKGSIIYPEKNKTKLDINDMVIGNYWFDCNWWCFSLFPNYQYLSV